MTFETQYVQIRTPEVPTTAAEAAKTFRCTVYTCTLSGRACAARWRRVNGAPKPDTSSDRECHGCNAGAARARLIPITGQREDPMPKSRPSHLIRARRPKQGAEQTDAATQAAEQLGAQPATQAPEEPAAEQQAQEPQAAKRAARRQAKPMPVCVGTLGARCPNQVTLSTRKSKRCRDCATKESQRYRVWSESSTLVEALELVDVTVPIEEVEVRTSKERRLALEWAEAVRQQQLVGRQEEIPPRPEWLPETDGDVLPGWSTAPTTSPAPRAIPIVEVELFEVTGGPRLDAGGTSIPQLDAGGTIGPQLDAGGTIGPQLDAGGTNYQALRTPTPQISDFERGVRAAAQWLKERAGDYDETVFPPEVREATALRFAAARWSSVLLSDLVEGRR